MPSPGRRSTRGLTGPAGTGIRLEWMDLPATVRAAVEGHLHGRIRRIEVQRGGFSPAFAGIVTDASGEETFVKAGGPTPNPEVPVLYRREWSVASALPANVPAPRARWSEDDGEWVTIAFEAIRGKNPSLPWKKDDLDRVVRAHRRMASALTPSPIEAPSVQQRLASAFRGFRTLTENRDRSAIQDAPLDPWIRRHLEDLALLEGTWEDLAGGTTLLHNDVRADNIVLRGEEVFFVDWPHACVGPAWFDLIGLLPSVAMQGGPRPWGIFDASELGRDAPADAVRSCVAAMTGYFVERSLRPPPPGLPTVREFQRAQGVEAVRWLRRLTPELR
jgi:aminoglycoside phosphotransferase (APT) family kinase protein